MCDNRWEKDFCSSCLEAFSTKKKLKPHIKEWFIINGKQRIIISEKGIQVKFRNYGRKKDHHL